MFLIVSFALSILPNSAISGYRHSLASINFAPKLSDITPLSPELRSALTLSQSICRAEFPLLYPQLEVLKQYWSQLGGIKKADVDRLEEVAGRQDRWNWARVVIKGGRLWIRSYRKGQDTRQKALLALLNNAVLSDPAFANSNGTFASVNGQLLPPIDLVMSAGDKDGFPGYDEGPGWVLSKRINDKRAMGNWLAPDFGFMGWPEIQAPTHAEIVDLQRKTEMEWSWERKDDRAFWRGFPNIYPVRKDLMDRTRAASHLPMGHEDAWADVFATTFGGEDGPEYRPLVALKDHCHRKYLIHSEGNSYSGRSKYLLTCHAVTIAHPLEWTQHFHPALISDVRDPRQNFVELPGPHFEGLEEVVRGLWDSDGRKRGSEGSWMKARGRGLLGLQSARKIADNVRDGLRDRYLTPAAIMCYWRAALAAYGEVQATSTWNTSNSETGPDVFPGNGDVSKGHSLGSAGGVGDISYENWNLIGAGDWPPPSA